MKFNNEDFVKVADNEFNRIAWPELNEYFGKILLVIDNNRPNESRVLVTPYFSVHTSIEVPEDILEPITALEFIRANRRHRLEQDL